MLVERLKDKTKYPELDFVDDWKMLTIFIGGNDLCRACLDKVRTALTSITLHKIRPACFHEDPLPTLHEK